MKKYSPLIGGGIGVLFSLIFNDSALVTTLNTIILGAIIGCIYGWITASIFSEKISNIKYGVLIGGTLGALFGLHYITFVIFVFGYAFFLVYIFLLAIGIVIEDFLGVGEVWSWIVFAILGGIFGGVFGAMLEGVGLITGVIFGAIPLINFVFAFILGGWLGVSIMEEIVYALHIPFSLIPTLAIAGYVVAKIKEILRELKRKEEIERKKALNAINEAQSLLQQAKELGINIEQDEKKLNNAKLKLDGKNFSTATKLANECKNSLNQKINEYSKEFIDLAYSKIKEAEERGINVSDAKDLHKKAISEFDNREYGRARELAEEANRVLFKMPEIRPEKCGCMEQQRTCPS